jgi:hypothetical protein
MMNFFSRAQGQSPPGNYRFKCLKRTAKVASVQRLVKMPATIPAGREEKRQAKAAWDKGSGAREEFLCGSERLCSPALAVNHDFQRLAHGDVGVNNEDNRGSGRLGSGLKFAAEYGDHAHGVFHRDSDRSN